MLHHPRTHLRRKGGAPQRKQLRALHRQIPINIRQPRRPSPPTPPPIPSPSPSPRADAALPCLFTATSTKLSRSAPRRWWGEREEDKGASSPGMLKKVPTSSSRGAHKTLVTRSGTCPPPPPTCNPSKSISGTRLMPLPCAAAPNPGLPPPPVSLSACPCKLRHLLGGAGGIDRRE